MNVPSVAKHVSGRWVDGALNPITGDHPLAQLGVGGQFVHPWDGRTYTIREIDTSQTDSKGRPFVIVKATT